ncbi:transcription termination/antitermination factor NusG [Candidatus Endolissoclinum faulkneri L2]|uniref:Transcription termination/antitermination protein NusG n=1 Tax=Candidatus Endolissoclinum faulkneri L2 TaxID=1193729 RepID=K7YPH2_9PROT|nr:transcription termination/antitermination protein NusG [Candidatus Endolissoclinum faulkneri]AFX98449.1 transcription termination/antitermination factor NusG [Candidatus Endolissoclinum faulkneri L2]
MTQRWYVVQVYSGFEKRVAQSINERVARNKFEDLITEILVPTEEVIEVRRGIKATKERKFFPGYILIKMELTDEVWHLVRSQSKVAGFVGGKSKPIPISQIEADRLLKQVSEGIDRPQTSINFEIGEQVRVSDGPFATFNGLVEDVDDERSRLKVAVSIFGRSTPVDLDFNQVEKN